MSNETYLTILTIGLCILFLESAILIYLFSNFLKKIGDRLLKVEESKKEEIKTRVHKTVAKVNYSTPMQNYEQYKDKQSGLYEPRRPSKGLKIEEREEAE